MKTTNIAILLTSLCQFATSAAESTANYVAHEWGTFTSVQAANGELITWNPLVTSQLPGFVYDRKKLSSQGGLQFFLGKENSLALQRMETPVIYFYSAEPRTVDVTVRFPRGVITEWYPFTAGIGPAWPKEPGAKATSGIADPRPALTAPIEGIKESLIRWSDVRLDGRARTDSANVSLPEDGSGSHYYAARETDADLLRVAGPPSQGGTTETERFLFYRGLGWFSTPLTVRSEGSDQVSVVLQNRGSTDLRGLFVLEVQDSRARLVPKDRLVSGGEQQVDLEHEAVWSSLEEVSASLRTQMARSLEEQGLYAREARAMVETWRNSWFNEQGLRVLYVLPEDWTDQTLPIQMKPTPRELVRVMVGRAELLKPEVERQVTEQIVLFGKGNAETKARVARQFAALHLGRFAEAAIRHALGNEPSKARSEAGWALFTASQKEASHEVAQVVSSARNTSAAR